MIVHVKVKPNSSKQEIVNFGDFRYLVYLKSPPEDNKANIELINLMSKHLRVSPAKMHISFGKSSDEKMIKID